MSLEHRHGRGAGGDVVLRPAVPGGRHQVRLRRDHHAVSAAQLRGLPGDSAHLHCLDHWFSGSTEANNGAIEEDRTLCQWSTTRLGRNIQMLGLPMQATTEVPQRSGRQDGRVSDGSSPPRRR